MRTKDNYTPKEEAQNIAMGYLRLAYEGKTADIEEADDRPSVQRGIRRQVAKLHNKLLRDSGMDGLELEEEL